MSLKTFVKVSKVSSLSDARYCAGMMVDMIGFHMIEGTEDFVAAQEFQEITEWVAGVAFVGEFENSSAETVKLAMQEYDLHFIEVTNIDLLEELSGLDKPLIYKKIIKKESDLVDAANHLKAAEELVEFSIIELEDPSLISPTTEMAKNLDMPLLKAYDVNEKRISSMEDFWKGIQLIGTPEDKPGFKDYGEVMDVLEQLEED